MKRLTAALCALLLAAALWLLPLGAGAEELPPQESPAADELVTVSVELLPEGKVGEEYDLRVFLSGGVGVDSLQFRLNYDPAAVQLTDEPAAGAILSEGISIISAEDAGLIVFGYAGALGLAADGTVMTVPLSLLSDQGASLTLSEVSISRVNIGLEQSPVCCTVVPGGISAAPDGALPSPCVTPWIPPTPTPGPTPTPSPTPEPLPELIAEDLPEPDPKEGASSEPLSEGSDLSADAPAEEAAPAEGAEPGILPTEEPGPMYTPEPGPVLLGDEALLLPVGGVLLLIFIILLVLLIVDRSRERRSRRRRTSRRNGKKKKHPRRDAEIDE